MAICAYSIWRESSIHPRTSSWGSTKFVWPNIKKHRLWGFPARLYSILGIFNDLVSLVHIVETFAASLDWYNSKRSWTRGQSWLVQWWVKRDRRHHQLVMHRRSMAMLMKHHRQDDHHREHWPSVELDIKDHRPPWKISPCVSDDLRISFYWINSSSCVSLFNWWFQIAINWRSWW